MANLLDRRDHPALRRLDDATRLFSGRNAAIVESYKGYYQFDKLKTPAFGDRKPKTVATSELRVAADTAIHLLSRNAHVDMFPKVSDTSEQARRDKAERFFRGMWMQTDDRYLLQGRAWHQREQAAWFILTGWVVQYTALLPGLDGTPKPFADLLDVSAVYPWWEGPDGGLSSLAYIVSMSGARFKAQLAVNGITVDEKIEDDTAIVQLDFWEERANKLNRQQPDILNSVFYSIRDQGLSPAMATGGWRLIQDGNNLAPGTSVVGKRDGYTKLPFIILRPDRIPIVGAYLPSQADADAQTAGGMIQPMLDEWHAKNELISTMWEDVVQALRASTTYVHQNPGAEPLTQADLGTVKTTMDSSERLDAPLSRNPMVGPLEVMIQRMTDDLTSLSFPRETRGEMTRLLSGVALDNVLEAQRIHVEPYKTGGEFLYRETNRRWADDYKRRWGASGKGKVEFDEEHTPAGFPERHDTIRTDLRLAQHRDLMMQANIVRALNPEMVVSADWLRENVLRMQDLFQEARDAAGSRVEQSAVFGNVEVMTEFVEQALTMKRQADETSDEDEKSRLLIGAEVRAMAVRQMKDQLLPQQGQGIPERPGQGPPEAGGNLTNSGGARPALSPENQTVVPGEVAAPAGPGLVAQAERNLRGQ